MKKRVLILLFLLTIVSISFIFAADLAGENLPSTCDGTSCKPNPNYDANKPTNAGKVMGFDKADYVTLEKGDGALIEKETREIEINKEQKVTIKGVEYNLPSKAKIKFVKENNIEKTIITLPDGTSVTDPKVVDKEMAKDAVFEIKAESGKLKLGKDSLEGTLSFESDKDGNLHKFLEGEKCNLGGLALTQKKGEKTEIFSDGELHSDAKGAYLSVGDKSVAIGKNSEGKGPEVKFEPGNRFLDKITTEQNVVMSAGRDADKKNSAAAGTIKITNRGDNAPEVAVDKSFTIANGKFEMNTGKTSKGKEGFLIKVDERLGKSYAIEITNEKGFVNSAGNKYKYVMDSNNQMEVAALEREPIKFNTDLKESGRDTLITWAELSPLLPRVNLGGGNIINTNFEGKLGLQIIGRTGPYNSALDDVKDHNGGRLDSTDHGSGHETTHEINSYIRNNLAPKEYVMRNGQRVTDNSGGSLIGGYGGFYLLNGKYELLKEPEFDISDVNQNIPEVMKTQGSYGDYIATNMPTNLGGPNQMKNSGNEPLYIFDELTAYTNGGIVRSQLGGNRIPNIPDFMSYSIALGVTVQQKDTTYWNNANGEKFRNFLGYSLERAMDTYTKQVGDEKTAQQHVYSMTDEKGREFLRKTYGPVWTRNKFGF